MSVCERRAGEGDKAFAAYRAYAELGAQRSLVAVAAKLGKSKSLMERWSVRYRWSERVAAHDQQLALVEQQAQEAAVIAKAPEWARRREEQKETEWQLRGELIAAARRVLKRFLDGGRGATLGDVARALEIASKLGRLSSGLPNEVKEINETVEGKIEVEWEVALKRIYQPSEKSEVRMQNAEVIEAEVVDGR